MFRHGNSIIRLQQYLKMKIIYATNDKAEVPTVLANWCYQNNHDLLIGYNLDQIELLTLEFQERDLLIADRLPLILPQIWLEKSKFLSVNVHPSLLPRHKGSYAQFWSAILDNYCGVSIHEITHELDSGDLFLQSGNQIDVRSTFRQFYAGLRLQTERLIVKFLQDHYEGRVERSKQGESLTPVHTKKTTIPLLAKLPHGWDTKISDARLILENDLSSLDWVISIRNKHV